MKWLSAIIGFFYVVLGVFIIIYKFFVIILEPNIAYLLGGLMIVYGIYRVLRVFYKANENDEE